MEDDESEKEKIFEGLRNNRPALLYPFFFALRRYCIIAILTFGISVPVF